MKTAALRLLYFLTGVAVILGAVWDYGPWRFPVPLSLVLWGLMVIVGCGWYVAWRLELRRGQQRMKETLHVDRGWLGAPDPATTRHVEDR